MEKRRAEEAGDFRTGWGSKQRYSGPLPYFLIFHFKLTQEILLFSSFFRWGNGVPKRLNILPAITANKQNSGMTSKPCFQATLLNISSTRELYKVRSTPKRPIAESHWRKSKKGTDTSWEGGEYTGTRHRVTKAGWTEEKTAATSPLPSTKHQPPRCQRWIATPFQSP